MKAAATSVLAGGASAQEPAGPYDEPTARFDKAKQDQLPKWAFRDRLWIPLVPRPVAVGEFDTLTKPHDGSPPPFCPTDPVPIGHVFHGIAREWGETPLHWKDFGCNPSPEQSASESWKDKQTNFGCVESHQEKEESDEPVELIRNWGHFPIKCYKMPITELQKQLARSQLPARLYGYGGMVPGPTMKMRLGQPAVVRFENHLETEVSVHLHGAHSPSHSDGFPSFYVLQGKSRDYFYPNILPLRKPKDSDRRTPRPLCRSPKGLVVDDGEAQSTMWYHDHGMDGTGYNVAKGLAGFALCFGERELELIAKGILPGLGPDSCKDPEQSAVKSSAKDIEDLEHPEYPGFYKREKEPYANPFDIPIVLQDKVIDPNTGQIAYETAAHNGYLGHTFLLNGVAYPYLEVSNRKYRFRFLNGSNARIYRLRLLSEVEFHARCGGEPVSVPTVEAAEENDEGGGGAGRSLEEASLPFLRIGKDSWLWSKAERKKQVLLAMANRADIVVDFKLLASHLKSKEDQAVFYLVNTMPQADGRGPKVKFDDGGDPRVLPLPIDTDADPARGIPETRVAELDRPIPLMKIIVKGPPLDSKLDATVEHGTKLIHHHPIGDDEVQVVREFIFERGKGAWKVNGRFYDPNIANATPTLGSAEEWVIRNGGGGWWHPIHIHLESHQLVSYQKDFEADEIVDTGDPPAIPRLTKLVELVDKFDEGHQRGLHDTQILGPNTVARIRMRFRTWSGPFVFHCHNLEHEDMRMMFNFEPVPRPFSDSELENPSRFDRLRKLANVAPDARTHGNDVTLQPDPKAPGYRESDRRIGELDWKNAAVPTTPVEDTGAYQIPPRKKEGP